MKKKTEHTKRIDEKIVDSIAGFVKPYGH